MSKIENTRLKNKNLISAFGTFSFNKDGIADIDNEEFFKELLKMKGFFPVDFSNAENGQKPDQIPEETSDATSYLNTEEVSQETENSDAIEDEDVDLDKLTVPQLKKYAKEHDVDLMDATKKDEIISIILGATK